MFNTCSREAAINTIILLPGEGWRKGQTEMNVLESSLFVVVESYHTVLYILELRLLVHS